MKVISTYPIEKYYNAADRLFVSFQQAFDDRRLDEAYVLGVRYATFSLESLPKHSGYKSKYKTMRLKNARQVNEVLQKVESLTERMDAEEKVKQQEDQKRQQKQKEEEERIEQQKQQKENEEEERINQMKRKLDLQRKEESQKNVENSARAKLSKLAALMKKSDKEQPKEALVKNDRTTDEQPNGEAIKKSDDKDAAELRAAEKASEEKAAAQKAAVEKEAAEKLARQEAIEAKAQQEQEGKKREAEEALLAQERQRLAEQAEKLDRQHKERAEREEMETMNFLRKEAEQAEKEAEEQEAEQVLAAIVLSQEDQRLAKERKKNEEAARSATIADLSATVKKASDKETLHPELHETAKPKASTKSGLSMMANLFAPIQDLISPPQPTPTFVVMPGKPATERESRKPKERPPTKKECQEPNQQPLTKLQYKKPKGLRPEEERTIEVLRRTIVKQEARLKETEEVKIPALLREAKAKLTLGERKAAAGCVARKRRLVKDVDMLKGAIFTMETQIMLLDSAVENREVAKAMKAATEAMESLQVDVSSVDVNDMNRVMDEMAQGIANDVMLDEDELLSELEGTYAENDPDLSLLDSHTMLSLPVVPANDMPTASVKTPAHQAIGMMGSF